MKKFLRFLQNNLIPNSIVFSTEKAKTIIGKNNLTPAQFLRPFGFCAPMEFSVDNYITILNDLRIDFFDSDNYKEVSYIDKLKILDYILSKSYPKIDKNINKNIYEILNSNINMPWFEEYGKTIVELNYFSEYELYQQPLCFIYFCSIDDDITTVVPKLSNREQKKRIPSLITERIYDNDMPVLVIILNDKSPEAQKINDDQRTKYIDNFKTQFKQYYLLYWEVNDIHIKGNNNLTEKNKKYQGDIWQSLIHNFEKYNSNYKEGEKGGFISLLSRERFHIMICDFFKNYAIKQIEKKVRNIDRYITENKKGVKNAFLSFFKNDTAIESISYNDHYKMYELTQNEFQEYFISFIYFYFGNYSGSKEILTIFLDDIKRKSQRHYNCAFELRNLCNLMLGISQQKDDFFSSYTNHLNSKSYYQACRSLFLGIKMAEDKNNYALLVNTLYSVINTMPSFYNSNLNNVYINHFSPIIFEQLSIYYLYIYPGRNKKFVLNIMQAALRYITEFKYYIQQHNTLTNGNYFLNYAIYDLLLAKEVILNKNTLTKSINYKNSLIYINDNSFLFIKEFLINTLATLCNEIKCNELSLLYSEKYLDLYIQLDPDYALKNVEQNFKNFIENNKILQAKNVNELIKINDYFYIDNSNLLFIDEQDYEINSNENGNFFANPANWSFFDKYDYIPVEQNFLCLTPIDIAALNNLDNILLNKQNFISVNKKDFHINLGEKMYARFTIENRFPFEVYITNMKLMYEFLKNDNETNNNKLNDKDINEYVIAETKNIKLEKEKIQKIELYIQIKKEGKLIIKGVEYIIENICKIEHDFNKKSINILYKYIKPHLKKNPRKDSGNSNSSSSSSNSTSNNVISTPLKKNRFIEEKLVSNQILVDIKNNENDIIIEFPLGKNIVLYKNELLLMPIKIINNSEIKIKRFCFYLNDGIHKKQYYSNNNNKEILKDDLYGCCFLNELIYKEIEIKSGDSFLLYVPVLPRKKGENFLKIIFKFEEDKTFNDHEIKRHLIKFNVKNKYDFIIQEKLLGYYNTNIKFLLNFITYYNESDSLINFKILDIIYMNNTYKLLSTFTNKENINIQNNLLIGNKNFILQKNLLENCINDKNYKFDFINIDIENEENKHIKVAYEYLLEKNNLVFIWECEDMSKNKKIIGNFIYKPYLQLPSISNKFLLKLINDSIKINYNSFKLQNDLKIPVLIQLEINFNKNIFKEIKSIKSFEIYIQDNSLMNMQWIGLNKQIILNNFNNDGNDYEENNNENIKLNFSCIINKEGKYNINQIAFKIYSNIPKQKEKILLNILNPILLNI